MNKKRFIKNFLITAGAVLTSFLGIIAFHWGLTVAPGTTLVVLLVAVSGGMAYLIEKDI